MAIAFGDTLKSLRTGKSLSQQQLADKLFVNRSSIANWESGRRLPDLVLLHRIATFFNVDISTLTDVAIQDQAPPEVIIVDDETILLAGVIPILSEVMPGATITGFSKPSEAINESTGTVLAVDSLLFFMHSCRIPVCPRAGSPGLRRLPPVWRNGLR